MAKSGKTEDQARSVRARIPGILKSTRGNCDANMIAAELMIPWKVADLALKDLALQYQCRLNVIDSEDRTRYHFVLPLRQRKGHPTLVKFTFWILGGGLRTLIRLSLGILLLLYGGVYLLALAAIGHGNLQEILPKGSWKTWWPKALEFADELTTFVAGTRSRVGVPSSMMERIYTFLAQNAGVMTCADVMALTGCDYATADHFMTWMMLVDKGSVRVTDDGILIYIFPDFRRDIRHEHKRSGWIWTQKQQGAGFRDILRINQNQLLFIGLGFSGSALTNIYLMDQGITGGFIKLILAEIPLWLSAGAMAIPMLRWCVGFPRRGSRLTEQLQIDILRVIHDELRPYSLTGDLDKFAARTQCGTSDQLRKYVSAALRAIGGAFTVDEKGDEALDSPSLRNEWKLSVMARDRILAGAPPPGQPIKAS